MCGGGSCRIFIGGADIFLIGGLCTIYTTWRIRRFSIHWTNKKNGGIKMKKMISSEVAKMTDSVMEMAASDPAKRGAARLNALIGTVHQDDKRTEYERGYVHGRIVQFLKTTKRRDNSV
jgi:hypothetical protein